MTSLKNKEGLAPIEIGEYVLEEFKKESEKHKEHEKEMLKLLRK